jgi:hypothetical protein
VTKLTEHAHDEAFQFRQILEREANTVYESILRCTPNKTVITLIRRLGRMRAVVVRTCREVHQRAPEELDSFMLALHDAYLMIAQPFVSEQMYEVPFKVYWHMLETTEECAKLTGHRFHQGFERANLSIAELGLRNLDEAFSNMELAQVEDDTVGHKTGVAKSNLRYILGNAYASIDALLTESQAQSRQKAGALCEEKLEWGEKARLAKCVWKFQRRIKDNRSSLNNDDLERNLLNICKIVENYLKRKNPIPDLDPRRQTLIPLVKHAFSRCRWLDEWNTFSKERGLGYADPDADDKKLVGLLTDKSRSHEANIFLTLCIIRNFGAHIFNDRSRLFSEEDYDMAFSVCIEALMYTVSHV